MHPEAAVVAVPVTCLLHRLFDRLLNAVVLMDIAAWLLLCSNDNIDVVMHIHSLLYTDLHFVQFCIVFTYMIDGLIDCSYEMSIDTSTRLMRL